MVMVLQTTKYRDLVNQYQKHPDQSDYLVPPKRSVRPKCYNSKIETESKLSITRNILDTSKRCCGSEIFR